MGDPWYYCENCRTFLPPTEPLWFTQSDGRAVALCDDCYRAS